MTNQRSNGAQWGYYTDNETGLILCTHRYYDPANARWLTRDPIGYEGGVNLYGYVGGDPVNNVDPEGYSLFSGMLDRYRNKREKRQLDRIRNKITDNDIALLRKNCRFKRNQGDPEVRCGDCCYALRDVMARIGLFGLRAGSASQAGCDTEEACSNACIKGNGDAIAGIKAFFREFGTGAIIDAFGDGIVDLATR